MYEIGDRVLVKQGRNAGEVGTVRGMSMHNIYVDFGRSINVRDDIFNAASGRMEPDAYWLPAHMVEPAEKG
jgi:hypothetical protein